jgi:hypothetical protein
MFTIWFDIAGPSLAVLSLVLVTGMSSLNFHDQSTMLLLVVTEEVQARNLVKQC